ncbi:MAG: pilus assembly protein TadG-related protein, partial [Acidimicrobiia bacterium]
MRRHSDEGAVLVWVAGSIVALMLFAALAVDLGWFYLNSSRLQNAADAAALAGVVDLPGFLTQAQSDADDAAAANGFPGSVTSLVPLADNSLEVTLQTTVPTFFLRVAGFINMTISRTSTAEYIKPV